MTDSKVLRAYYRQSDLYDKWGSTMAWLFAIADYITFELGDSVPDEWQFKPALGGPDTESYEYEVLNDIGADMDDMRCFGNALWRLRANYERMGLDY